MPNFHVADLTPRGDLVATVEYGYDQLEQIPAAAELIERVAGHVLVARKGSDVIATSATQKFTITP